MPCRPRRVVYETAIKKTAVLVADGTVGLLGVSGYYFRGEYSHGIHAQSTRPKDRSVSRQPARAGRPQVATHHLAGQRRAYRIDVEHLDLDPCARSVYIIGVTMPIKQRACSFRALTQLEVIDA